MRTLRQAALTLIATLCVALCGIAGAEQTSPARVTFNIPQQPLADALAAWSRQSGLQVLRRDKDAVVEVVSGKVSGEFSPVEALQRLLANTGLKYEFVNERTVRITPANKNLKTNADAIESLRLVKDASLDAVEEMLVEGERDKLAPFTGSNLDLTRTADDVLPFTVFTARDIELSGASNLQEFLQNRLPQNFTADFPDELDGEATSPSSRVNRIDLRGWGVNETVFLLNGRRMGAQYQGAQPDTSNATPNLQGIPLGSIERIEIIASAASAIYGANATGGVINLITRQDYRGGQLAVSYESVADVHAPRRRADFSYGLPMKWGSSLRLSGSYGENKPLRAADRADVTIERWRRLALERQPTRLIARVANDPFRANSFVFGATPNIRAIATTITGKPGNLFADLPGAQAANFTTVPAGYAGIGGLAAFQPGVYNLAVSDGPAGGNWYGKDSTLGALATNMAFSLGMDKRFADHWSWSLDYRYSENDSEGGGSGELQFSSSPNSNRPRVPGSASINPFGQDVQVYLIDPRLARPELRNTPDNATWELASVLRGSFGEWHGFMDFNYSHNRNHSMTQTFHEPYGGWTRAFVDGDYNPFVDIRTVAPATADFYENYVMYRYRAGSATRSYLSGLKASGPVLSLPGGAVQLTVGAEWSRTDRYQSFSIAQYMDSVTGAPRTPVCCTSDIAMPLSQDPYYRFVFDSYSGYAEMTVPLLTRLRHLPLADQLELFGSGRFNHDVRNGFKYEFSGGDTTRYSMDSYLYVFGLRYAPVSGLSFRASSSIGFKPPSMEQITPYTPEEFGYPADYILTLTDPVREEVVFLPTSAFSIAGNPDLKPETSRSTNLGLILSPAWMSGLRFSVDYIDTVRNDAISSLNELEIFALEAELPNRVQRGAPDGNASGVGPVTFLNMRSVNLAQVASRSMDFSLEQRLPDVLGGRLVLNGAATKNLSFKVQTTALSSPVEQVRNREGGISRTLEWNANAQLRWEGMQWSFGWSTRYYDYVLARSADFLLQGGDRAPWVLNHDFNLNYRTRDSGNARGLRWLLSGASMSFGVKNIFDREPRFWAATTNKGVAPYDSILGRSLWLQMRKSFGQ